MKKIIKLNVNGETYEVNVEVHSSLLEVLRGQLNYTGVKQGCDGTGECGTCTVLINGKPVYSCLLLAVEADGCNITTIEGLAKGDKLHSIQEAFMQTGALQCGFCTPGMILTTKALLEENPRPTLQDIGKALEGNLCRCTGYTKIFEAVQIASKRGGD
ncbi:MAG: (2Fe-2S)-binding protein [Candidatus Bathyarchaeia archaeon]